MHQTMAKPDASRLARSPGPRLSSPTNTRPQSFSELSEQVETPHLASRFGHKLADVSVFPVRDDDGMDPARAPLDPTSEQHGGTPTSLPSSLKTEIRRLSGFSLDAVRVYHNSEEPARLGAAALTRGTEIHLGPKEDGYLPHEAWHVVQQMQGRVAPTGQLNGLPINADPSLEREADAMGARAHGGAGVVPAFDGVARPTAIEPTSGVIQMGCPKHGKDECKQCHYSGGSPLDFSESESSESSDDSTYGSRSAAEDEKAGLGLDARFENKGNPRGHEITEKTRQEVYGRRPRRKPSQPEKIRGVDVEDYIQLSDGEEVALDKDDREMRAHKKPGQWQRLPVDHDIDHFALMDAVDDYDDSSVSTLERDAMKDFVSNQTDNLHALSKDAHKKKPTATRENKPKSLEKRAREFVKDKRSDFKGDEGMQKRLKKKREKRDDANKKQKK